MLWTGVRRAQRACGALEPDGRARAVDEAGDRDEVGLVLAHGAKGGAQGYGVVHVLYIIWYGVIVWLSLMPCVNELGEGRAAARREREVDGVVARLPVLLGLRRTDVWRLLVLGWEHHNGRQFAVLDRDVARNYVSAPVPATQTHLSLQLDALHLSRHQHQAQSREMNPAVL